MRSASIVVARQHATHAERDIVVANPSVCPTNAGIVSNEWTYIVTFFVDLVGTLF